MAAKGERKAELRRLRLLAMTTAAGQSGVLCRRQLRSLDIPRWLVQLEVRTGRWRRTGKQTVVTHNGPLDDATRRTIACFETGPGAALDGVSALQHAGVTGLKDRDIHVIAAKGSRPVRTKGVVVHESRRFRGDDVTVVGGVRTVRPAIASVHAALWATTDREATLVALLAVQQRRCRPQDVADAVGAVRRHRRRGLLVRLVADLVSGVRSLGELDVARAIRERGLPEPDRQVVRRRPSGTEYLDVRWEDYDVTLEIDGIQHEELEQKVSDVLRDFTLVAEGDAVLRLPLDVFRVAREQVLDRLERIFLSRGWRRAA